MSEDVTVDGFLDRTIHVVQPAKAGHRAGLDAVLLAACLSDIGPAQVADFGAGCGVAGLAVAARNPEARVALVENDATAAKLAQRSVKLSQNSALAARAEVLNQNVETALGADSADHVIANPPYNSAALQASRDAAKAAAHMGNVFGPWARAAARVLRTGGTATFIFRPRDVAAALGAFEGRFGGVTLRPVHPRVGEPASRLLMRGVRGSKAPLAMLPPLVLHEADGAFTPASDAILRGKTGIVMHL